MPFWYLPTSTMHAKILARIRDHICQFFGNCWTLSFSDQNLFRWFQLWCWAVEQEMKSKDQAIIKIFYIKQSNNLGRKRQNQTVKGCVYYIFASLFFKSKRESSVFCSSLGQRLKISSKKISPIPLYTYF